MTITQKLIAIFSFVVLLAACSTPSKPTTPTQPPAQTTTATTISMIKLEDDGKSTNSTKVGCGDSAIPIETTAAFAYDKTDPIAAINAALMTLFSTTEDQFSKQNLMNPITASALTMQKVEKPLKINDPYLVYLKGKFSFSGTCDVPRQRAQIEETIKAVALGHKTTIIWNGDAASWEENFSSK